MGRAKSIVEKMMSGDEFSRWLGINVISNSPGKCELGMLVRSEMVNGFGIAHGGITYSLADSALAFAANGYGIQSVSIDTSISHTKPVKIGDQLIASIEEKNLTNKIGIYHVTITNQEKVTVAIFKGTVYRTGKEWDL